MKKRWIITLALVALCGMAQAQFSGNDQTNLINNVINNWGAAYYVGDTYHDDTLIITNYGRLNNTLGYIGYESTADNNAATVTGPGSLWYSSDYFHLGYEGSGNTLTITNGGTFQNDNYSYIGRNVGSDHNAATVTGTDSSWISRGSRIGYYGSSNTLTIADGGLVQSSGTGYIGFQSTGNNNAVTVTGSDSVWYIGTKLYVGASGSDNTLVITNGGWVQNNDYGYVGFNAGSDNNAVTVTGAGSLWSNSSNLTVGVEGSGNTLTIANGGTVQNTIGSIGSTADNNAVTVTGAGSLWNNSSTLTVGDYGSGNSLTIMNSGTVQNGMGLIGYNAGANDNAVTVTGPGSVWNNSSSLYVGFYGSGNSLTITNGGIVNNTYSTIGVNSTAENNAVTVTGPGSVWSNSGDLAIGYFSDAATLTIADGGLVENTIGTIGKRIGADFNAVTVTGAGSLWSNSSNLTVGVEGSGNTLTIADGGTVQNTIGTIGSAADNNAVTVTGAGSLWYSSDYFYVGYEGSGNTLTINNGGTVENDNYSYIGRNVGSDNNAVTVTGDDSAWISSGSRIGYYGSSNTLTIADGGLVQSSGTGYIGFQSTGNNNAVTVTGTGSVWDIGTRLYVGASGSGNTLTIADGGA
ncbi:MAG: hypothetical protein ISR84_02225, partial [Kiritimatiellales bacterium]|nr:hypothetical protein [Kiritimatiellales bacterium]